MIRVLSENCASVKLFWLFFCSDISREIFIEFPLKLPSFYFKFILHLFVTLICSHSPCCQRWNHHVISWIWAIYVSFSGFKVGLIETKCEKLPVDNRDFCVWLIEFIGFAAAGQKFRKLSHGNSFVLFN